MGYLSADEVERFARAANDTVERQWRPSDQDYAGDLQKLWSAAASQGWFDLGTSNALAAVLALCRVTGRAACPLPVMDGFVAVRLLDAAADFAADAAAGAVRIVVSTQRAGAGSTVRFAEAGMVASHVLVVPPEGGRATLHAIEYARPVAGLAIPPWTDLELGAAVARVDLTADEADEIVVLLRLALATRALAAAERAHEMAVRHAKSRKQFGRAIGSFGAVQQRAATCQIDVSAGNLLIADAARRYGAGSPDWISAAELAVSHVAATARRVQQAAHYTLGAAGYFEGHDGPWLFRRVHADIACLPLFGRSCGEFADVLVNTDTALPDPDLPPEAEALRAEFRLFVSERPAPDGISETSDDMALVDAMAARGWFGMVWPPDAGGRGATLAEQFVLQDEVAFDRLPVNNAMAAVSVVGTQIARHGTAQQRERYLPLIREGKLTFCLGYSEPDAGSDLAALTTSAVRDGDDWVINGRKAWITNAHTAQYVWLAVRTDPAATPPHAGISIFMVPMATPGIATQAHRALSGQVAGSISFDDVRVSDADRVGPVNRGWEVIADTLVGERLLLAGRFAATLHRQLRDLLAAVRRDPDAVGPRGSANRARLGALAAGVQAVRQLLAAAIRPLPPGAPSWLRLAVPMAGVLVGESAAEFGAAALDLLGPAAALGAGEPGVPGDGAFEYGLRLSVLSFLGGGTNDVQRGLIARGLGLI
ncbi:MAG TPA: acyl-CoA dehydrogenase family protein [Actinocrinis sp.]|uniref:acyl-CoA dehydrogenase family protein n=1 Tax=Actinocrinis sp. TaxID=1920516 RepID=UPI002DDCCBF4|nr:acyl-CoA dehydrogenase family protein [Actinocrinis sp.]HEV2343270.1 acyl-CoA dehydrogenase family protein [Actinocrinis sp.]